MDSAFPDRLAAVAAEMETMLGRLLDGGSPEMSGTPPRLADAMRYAVLGGGKRLRPFLLVESARLFGPPGEGAIRAATALECLHCYSLVHDDLPAMDNDDLRRGRPTVHRAFDEATAILVGDGLLTLAFAILSAPETHPDPAVRLALVQELAAAAGPAGMVGGQALDMEGEGRPQTAASVGTLQAMKTGALFRFSAEAGAIVGSATAAQRAALRTFGAAFGAAFQIADDLLDDAGDTAALGKAATKDAARAKPTLIAVHGRQAAEVRLRAHVATAEAALQQFGPGAEQLLAATQFVAKRG